jgi:hypothetical protein
MAADTDGMAAGAARRKRKMPEARGTYRARGARYLPEGGERNGLTMGNRAAPLWRRGRTVGNRATPIGNPSTVKRPRYNTGAVGGENVGDRIGPLGRMCGAWAESLFRGCAAYSPVIILPERKL